MISIEEQMKMIKKGALEIVDEEELREKLVRAKEENRPLIIKLGLDPSAPDLHLGHTVVLRKIRQLQDMGHRAIIIIGDFTGRIGDPTGKSKGRRQLTEEEVLENAKTYEQQLSKVIDMKKTEIRFNSQWLGRLDFAKVLELASKCTVARMLEREDFKNRFEAHQSIGIHELFYPLMQAYDSVALQADLEIGGNEQRYNILMGRTLQRDFNQPAQVALFLPLLIGTDGVEKMGKSLNNYIGVSEPPEVMYSKVMTIHDQQIVPYFELVTDVHPDELEGIKEALQRGQVHPRDIKMRLAKELTALYNGWEAAEQAEEHFIRVYQKGLQPENMQEYVLRANGGLQNVDISGILLECGFIKTKSEGRRLLEQGGVKLNKEKVQPNQPVRLQSMDVLQIGKRGFVKIKIE